MSILHSHRLVDDETHATALLVGALSLASCKNFLDVNTNPNAPQSVAANLYLAPMVHWMVTAPQYDGRFIGRYTQKWALANGQTTISTWDRMGYDPASDNGAEQWRDVYWSLGQNLVDMINKAEAEQRWDLAGVGYFMKAWGWQVLTDMHGEIIIKEAIDPTRSHLRLRHSGIRLQRSRSGCSTWRSRICSAPTARSTRRISRRRITCTTATARSG